MVAVRHLAKGGEVVTKQMVDDNTVTARMLDATRETKLTWIGG